MMTDFPNITILGGGLLGGSLALALAKLENPPSVRLWARKEETVSEAGKLGISMVTNDLRHAVENADLMILAIPIGSMASLVSACLEAGMPKGCLVTDVGSVKRVPHHTLGHVARRSWHSFHRQSSDGRLGKKRPIRSHPYLVSKRRLPAHQRRWSPCRQGCRAGALLERHRLSHLMDECQPFTTSWSPASAICHISSPHARPAFVSRILRKENLAAAVFATPHVSQPGIPTCGRKSSSKTARP